MSTAARTRTAQRTTAFIGVRLSQRIPHERTGHAVSTAPALAELEALDGDHLDARSSHLLDRVGVALVGDDDSWFESHHVVAVVPLLTLLLVGVTTGLDHAQVGHAEGVGDRREEALLLGHV